MLVSIFSPKGGVGKTTLALALAVAFAKPKKLGKLSYKFKTCLVEFDFSPGDFASILDIDITKNIINAIYHGIDENIQEADGISVLLGGYPDMHEQIKRDDFTKLVNTLQERYDLVIVDIQPGFIERSIDVLLHSDIVLLLVEDRLNVAARVNGLMEWLEVNNICAFDRFYLVINKKKQKRLQYLDKMSYKIPVLFEIPYIKNVRDYKDKRIVRYAEKLKEKIIETVGQEAIRMVEEQEREIVKENSKKDIKEKKGRCFLFGLIGKNKRN